MVIYDINGGHFEFQDGRRYGLQKIRYQVVLDSYMS